MNYTEPKVIYTCFPGGKHKVLTMSYDDGRLEDRRLVELFNRYGIRGTFNLNGGLPRPERIPESEWVELYKGHEVACHTYHHPTISRSPLDQTARQVLAGRMQLEGVMGYPVRGLVFLTLLQFPFLCCVLFCFLKAFLFSLFQLEHTLLITLC